MYRTTAYINGEKTVDEHEDEDAMREEVEILLNDLEKGAINSFTVSRISKGTHHSPWWERR